MRIVIEPSLVTPEVRNDFVEKSGALNFLPFKALRHSTYPARLQGYQDFLWMGTTREARWEGRLKALATNLRRSAKDESEFLHAAHTQLVFTECDAILHGLKLGGRRRKS